MIKSLLKFPAISIVIKLSYIFVFFHLTDLRIKALTGYKNMANYGYFPGYGDFPGYGYFPWYGNFQDMEIFNNT